MKEKKKLSLGVWIMIGLVAGIAVGAILWAAMGAENATNFTASYLKPFGDIFVNLLKFIVVPLVLLSIMDGMFSMGDIGKVGKIGWKTVVYFLATTAVAVSYTHLRAGTGCRPDSHRFLLRPRV